MFGIFGNKNVNNGVTIKIAGEYFFLWSTINKLAAAASHTTKMG